MARGAWSPKWAMVLSSSRRFCVRQLSEPAGQTRHDILERYTVLVGPHMMGKFRRSVTF